MGLYPPSSQKDILKLLKKCGFVEMQRTGRKNHPYKFTYPSSRPDLKRCPHQPDFIIIPHKVDQTQCRYLLKQMGCWGFNEEKIRSIL